MQEMEDTEGSQEEAEEEDEAQNMELEETKVDIKALIEVHGEQEVNKMQVSQLRKLNRELKKGKGNISSQENPTTSENNLGIKRNPLKNKKKPSGEEK
jgi:hypothetical protein